MDGNYLLQVLQEFSRLTEVDMVTTISISLRKYARNMAAKCTTDEGLHELFKGQISVTRIYGHRSCKYMFTES